MGGEIRGNTTNSIGHFSPAATTTRFSPSQFISPNPCSSSCSNFSQPLFVKSAHVGRDETEGETSTGSSVDTVFWSVPTQIEVQNALAALHSFMQGLSSSRFATDEHQPSWSHVHVDPRILNSPAYQRVYDAFHLLQAVPSVERMVTSISSDRAVWHAVLSNNQVQEFQHSVHQATLSRGAQGPNEEEEDHLDMVSIILRWILDNMRLKLVELIDALKSVVSSSPSENDNTRDSNSRLKQQFEEMICSAVLLSVITLMIVLVTRAYGS